MNNAYWVCRTASRSLFHSFYSTEVVGAEKKIEEGGAIIASNHASFLDPPLLGGVYERPVAYLARNTLFKGPMAWLLPQLNAFPIDRDQADLRSMKTILRLLREGERLVMFPEGTRSPDGTLQDAKAGIGMLVAKSRVPVQPVRLLGTHAGWPRGGSLHRTSIRVVIGDPIVFTDEELGVKSREGYQAIADRLMKEIGALQ